MAPQKTDDDENVVSGEVTLHTKYVTEALKDISGGTLVEICRQICENGFDSEDMLAQLIQQSVQGKVRLVIDTTRMIGEDWGSGMVPYLTPTQRKLKQEFDERMAKALVTDEEEKTYRRKMGPDGLNNLERITQIGMSSKPGVADVAKGRKGIGLQSTRIGDKIEYYSRPHLILYQEHLLGLINDGILPEIFGRMTLEQAYEAVYRLRQDQVPTHVLTLYSGETRWTIRKHNGELKDFRGKPILHGTRLLITGLPPGYAQPKFISTELGKLFADDLELRGAEIEVLDLVTQEAKRMPGHERPLRCQPPPLIGKPLVNKTLRVHGEDFPVTIIYATSTENPGLRVVWNGISICPISDVPGFSTKVWKNRHLAGKLILPVQDAKGKALVTAGKDKPLVTHPMVIAWIEAIRALEPELEALLEEMGTQQANTELVKLQTELRDVTSRVLADMTELVGNAAEPLVKAEDKAKASKRRRHTHEQIRGDVVVSVFNQFGRGVYGLTYHLWHKSQPHKPIGTQVSETSYVSFGSLEQKDGYAVTVDLLPGMTFADARNVDGYAFDITEDRPGRWIVLVVNDPNATGTDLPHVTPVFTALEGDRCWEVTTFSDSRKVTIRLNTEAGGMSEAIAAKDYARVRQLTAIFMGEAMASILMPGQEATEFTAQQRTQLVVKYLLHLTSQMDN